MCVERATGEEPNANAECVCQTRFVDVSNDPKLIKCEQYNPCSSQHRLKLGLNEKPCDDKQYCFNTGHNNQAMCVCSDGYHDVCGKLE